MSSMPHTDPAEVQTFAGMTEKTPRFDPELLKAVMETEPVIDIESGLKVVQIDVKDGYENAEKYPGRKEFDAITNQWQEMLSEHPEWQAPERPRDESTGKTIKVIPVNPVSEALYGEEEARIWGRHMPDSYALWNLYHPEEDILPDGTEVTDGMRMVFRHLLDARGIRNRGKMIETLGIKYALQNTGNSYRWISHGGGAFAPAMHAAEALTHLPLDYDLHFEVYDLDQQAMQFGLTKAEERGLTDKADFKTYKADFREDFVTGDSKMVEDTVAQGGATFVENSGLTEYFGDGIAAKLIKNAYESTAPGGGFVFSNMRDDREQLDLNQRGVGWNKMYIRSLSELRDLMKKADIDPSLATVYQPSDGLYSIVEIAKPGPETDKPLQSPPSRTRRFGGAAVSVAA